MLDDPLYYGYKLSENQIHESRDDILHCLIVAVLIYTAALGCILGILSEFDITVNYALIAVIMLIASLFLSFIHLSRLLYVLGYFTFLFVYSYGLMAYRTYANSGYQAILNIVNKVYSDHYLLTAVREYEETIGDRYSTITCVAVFIGLFIVLLLNVGVFNDMFFFTTFNLTFWPLQLGIFIGRYPSYLSLALIFFAYFGVYFLRHSGHYFFVQPPTRRKPREYFFDYDDDNGRHMIFHKSNSRAMLAVAVLALIVSLVFGSFVSSAVITSEREALTNRSRMKVRMDESVKILTQNGIAGMFNRYQAKGGMNGGKLGGVRSISPDYETDLEVTFVPYSFETIYLKGYVGQQYAYDHWVQPSARSGYKFNMPGTEGPASQEETAKERLLMTAKVHSRLMENGFTQDHKAKLKVTNKDAATSYLYVPYFLSEIPKKTVVDPYSSLSGYSAIDASETYEFTPYSYDMMSLVFDNDALLDSMHTEDETAFTQEYDQEIIDNYLQIPPGIYDELMSYHEKIGTSDTVRGQVSLIYDYFLKNYKYDFAPGATPYGRDFVTYFLKDQKRGYCSHFASAATMLLRSYGIPARYVEGYVVSLTSITETAERLDEDPADYYKGDNPLGESAVINVEVSDGNAHAWTEVYIPSFGWFPVDLTVPATEDSIPAYSDFLSSLARLFRPTGDAGEEADETSAVDVVSEHIRTDLFDFKGTPVFLIFVIVLAVLMLIPLIKRGFVSFSAYIKRRRLYALGDNSVYVRHYYLRARKRIAKKLKEPVPELIDDTFVLINRYLYGPAKAAARLNEMLSKEGVTLNDIRSLMQKCFYAEEKISRSEADLLIKFCKKI
ncbi:MAG: transglutaminase domain-containing protein [Lachnospiraceae bacterium]|nr:transglutaminase domain-containing protein [Lachnospiraceae bacterium]